MSRKMVRKNIFQSIVGESYEVVMAKVEAGVEANRQIVKLQNQLKNERNTVKSLKAQLNPQPKQTNGKSVKNVKNYSLKSLTNIYVKFGICFLSFSAIANLICLSLR